MKYLLLLISYLNLIQSSRIVLVGGAQQDDNAEVYNKFIELSTTKSGYQYIGICTGASADEDAEENGQFYVDIYKKYGVKNVEWIPIRLGNPSVAYDPIWVNKIKQMTGIFFGGGDQSRLIQLFYTVNRGVRVDTPLLAAIRQEVNLSYLALGGTSAGTAIMQDTPMVTGGVSYYSLKYRPQTYLDPDGDRLSYNPEGGFKLVGLPLYIDTHFSQRGRQGRMISLIWENRYKTNCLVGAGVDENSALVVDGNKGTVLGTSGVVFIDLRQASQILKNSGQSSYLNINNVIIHFLTTGDEIDLINFTVTKYGSNKLLLTGSEHNPKPRAISYDIFGSPDNFDKNFLNLKSKFPREFTNVAQNLFDQYGSDSTYGLTYETTPEFRVDMIKTQKSKAFYNPKDLSQISFENMRVDIVSVKDVNAKSQTTFFISSLLNWVKQSLIN